MQRIFYIVFLLMVLVSGTEAQVKPFSFKQVEDLQKIKPKPVMVFIYTKWCNVCQGMKETTFKNKEVIELLNNQFYTIFLDAEAKENIVFNGINYSYKPTGNNTGLHELATQFANENGQVTFPTLGFLNINNQVIYRYGGYLNAADLMKTAKIILNND